MGWWRMCGLTLLFVLLTSLFARAYERDVHYDLTKYLAQWAGFSDSEAKQIATADQELDAKPEFNPLPNQITCLKPLELAGVVAALLTIPKACKDDPEFQRMLTAQRAYHFVDGKRLQELRDSAFRGKNLKVLGHYLHALQDTFAHSLMDYADLPPLDKVVASLGRLPDEQVIGHLLYGHSVDKTYERPDLAEQMARYAYTELTEFQGSANRWNDVEAAVARFVREKDLQKQVRYLSAPSPPAPPHAESHPSGLPSKSQEPLYEGRSLVDWQGNLRDPSSGVREKAAEALGHFGDKAVPILAQTLKDTDADVRWAAAHALGEIGPAAKDAVPALVRALKDPDDMVRGRAEVTLRRIDPSVLENWEQSEKAAAEEEARRRREVESAQRLGKTAQGSSTGQASAESSRAEEALYQGRGFAEWEYSLLRDTSPQERKKAVEALGHFGPRAIPVIIKAFDERDQAFSLMAARVLDKIGPPGQDEVPALVEILKRTDKWIVRAAAANALEKIGPPAKDAIPLLTNISVRDPDERVRQAAKESLERIEDRTGAKTRVRRTCKDKSGKILGPSGRPLHELAALLRSTRYVPPCSEEGDEARKAAADQVAAAFRSRYGIREMVECEPLTRNPFAYEGKSIGLKATFFEMAARDTGIFRGRADEESKRVFSVGADLLAGCPIVVSEIPQGTFGTKHQEVVLAAKVLGRSGKAPHLQFLGIHVCKEQDCADFFGPESLRKD